MKSSKKEENRLNSIRSKIEKSSSDPEISALLDKYEKEVAAKCVRPMHLCIEEKEVDAEHDFGPFVLSRAGGYMHYATKGGFHVLVSPSYEAMFKTLSLWLDLANKNGGTEDDGGMFSNISDFISSILFSDTIIFANEEYMFKQFDLVTGIVKELAESSEKELQKQDFEANADFEQGVKSAEQMAEILKKAAEEKGGDEENQ